MCTRANIVIQDGAKRIYLYHHSDGYPDGIGVELDIFMQGRYFQTAEECAEAIIGIENDNYELTTEIHGDIEFLYTIDLVKKTILCQAYNRRLSDIQGNVYTTFYWEEPRRDRQKTYEEEDVQQRFVEYTTSMLKQLPSEKFSRYYWRRRLVFTDPDTLRCIYAEFYNRWKINN